MTEPRDWPFERPATGTLRPWFLSAMGYLAVLFSDGVEAERTLNGLVESGVPNADLRLYPSSRTLEILAHQREERSAVARAVEALAADPAAKKRYVDNAEAGGSALWLYAPTADRADQLVRLLANYNYESARYYGDDGVQDILRDPG
jgi:hypothetical protein